MKMRAKTLSETRGPYRYEGSELDFQVGKMAQKMCLKYGREVVYVFFGSITGYINHTLPDQATYKRLFTSGNNDSIAEYIDAVGSPSDLPRKMMTTVMARLGGNSPQQLPAYWELYAKQQQQRNQQYLERLAGAAAGRGDTYKLHNDVADTANKVLEHGVAGAANSVMSEALSVNGVASMVTEQLIKITIWLLQRKMLNDSSSKFFTNEEKSANNAFEEEIIKSNGSCGKALNSSESAEEGLPRPYWFGSMNDLTIK